MTAGCVRRSQSAVTENDPMPNPWPLVPLGDAASPIERPTTPVPGIVYRQVGVKLWGQGAYERESIDGAETKYKSLSRVEAGDIIVNKIWARNGTVAVIPETLAGGYVSGEFPTFVPVTGELDPRWFHWFSKTPSCWEQCDDKSRGTSGKNRIRPERFLEIQIPLPPLDEQRRIVARIEQLAAKIEDARQLRQMNAEGAHALLDAEMEKTFSAVANSAEIVVIEKAGGFATSGPRGWGDFYKEDGDRRLIRVENVSDRDLNLSTAAKVALPPDAGDVERSQVRVGDVLVTITGAIGRVGVVRQFDLPCHVSQHVALLRAPTCLVPDYLYWYLRAPSLGKSQTVGKTYGATKPGINLTALRTLRVATPPQSEQRRIVAYLDDLQAKVDALKQLQAETAAELDALLPSILDRAFRGEL